MNYAVFAPRYRYFDLVDGMGEFDEIRVPFRAFQIDVKPRDRFPESLAHLYDIDQEISTSIVSGYLLDVHDELPPVSIGNHNLRVVSKDAITIEEVEYGIFLSDSEVAARYRGVKASFHSNGIFEGHRVEIEQWIIPGRLVKLKNVKGIYYPAFLEEDEA